jgi:tetratricopeptide (TPR) repeat protein
MPGTAFEGARLEKRRDEPTRAESEPQLIERARMCLSSGDYSSALALLRGAAAGSAGDGELSELETLAQDGVKRRAEADRLITESQELFAQQKFAEAIQLLRKAYELDKNNSLARSILANALVEHAQSIVETDWWEAETLANEALALNPAHPTARTIHSLIFDRKSAGSVEEWVSQTRKLQSSGNLSAALSQIAEGLSVYPHEARLLQIQDTIQRDYSARRRQARRRDLQQLRRTESEVDAVADVAARDKLAKRIKAVMVKYSTDGEILSVANGLLNRLAALEFPRKIATASDTDAPARIDPAAPPSAPEPSLAVAGQIPPNPVPPKQVPPNPVPLENLATSIVLPANAPLSIVPASSVAPIEIPDNPLAQQPAPPQTAAAPAAEPIAPTPTLTSLSSSIPPEQPARSNSTTLMMAAAAAMIVVATISYWAGTHHAPTLSKSPAAATSVAAPAVSASAVNAPVVSVPAISAPAQANPQPSSPVASQPAGQLPPDTAPRKVAQNIPQLAQEIPQQKIRVPNDDKAPHIVSLRPQPQPSPQPPPRLASLTIHGGAPGTAVLVDQTLVGTIPPDGTLSVSAVNPGDHTVELRKDRFQPRLFKEHFVVGGDISLAASDAALEAAPSELRITFAPADAKVAIVKGDFLATVTSGVPLNLAAGTYTLTARTADKFTRSATFEVVAGQSRTLDLSLAPSGMSKWDDPRAWKQEGDGFVRRGGDFVLYEDVPASGTFVFSAMAGKGHPLQWVLNYTDPKNYVLLQMDDDNFSRTVIRNGEKTDQIKVSDKGDKKSFRTLRIRVSPTEIVHQIAHGDRWTVLDRWTQPGANLSLGKFGFYLPGSDQVALSSFSHYVDLNLR